MEQTLHLPALGFHRSVLKAVAGVRASGPRRISWLVARQSSLRFQLQGFVRRFFDRDTNGLDRSAMEALRVCSLRRSAMQIPRPCGTQAALAGGAGHRKGTISNRQHQRMRDFRFKGSESTYYLEAATSWHDESGQGHGRRKCPAAEATLRPVNPQVRTRPGAPVKFRLRANERNR
jgi:hypothetical protein